MRSSDQSAGMELTRPPTPERPEMTLTSSREEITSSNSPRETTTDNSPQETTLSRRPSGISPMRGETTSNNQEDNPETTSLTPRDRTSHSSREPMAGLSTRMIDKSSTSSHPSLEEEESLMAGSQGSAHTEEAEILVSTKEEEGSQGMESMADRKHPRSTQSRKTRTLTPLQLLRKND